VEDLGNERPVLNLCWRELGFERRRRVLKEEVFTKSSDVKAGNAGIEVDFGWGGDVGATRTRQKERGSSMSEFVS
jgi:hypothetical protein